MIDFVFLKEIEYNNKRFAIFTSKKYPIYFMEVGDDGNYHYPKFEDLVSLLTSNKTRKINTILNSGVINYNNINNKLKKIKLSPKVIYKSMLISLTTAILMSGCTKNNTTSSLDNKYREDVIAECKDLGYDVYFSDYNVPFLHEFYCEDFGGETIFCRNVDEFKDKLDIKNTYTYDDVRKCFDNNKNIPNEYRKWLFDGLDNMENELPDLDLTILYQNAKKMTFVNEDEFNDYSDNQYNSVPASFDIMTGEVTYSKSSNEMNKFTFCHEVLGHGSMEGLIETDNINVYYGFYLPMAYTEDDSKDIDYYVLGMSFTEAAADGIAKIASKTSEESIYDYASEEIRIVQELCGLSYTQMLNCRGFGLLDKMHKKNIDDPSTYLMCSDNILDCYRLLSSGEYVECFGISDVIEELVVDATEENVLKTGAIDNSVAIMKNCPSDIVAMCYYDTDDSIEVYDYYNPTESSNNVKEKLLQIKSNKKTIF